jgi:hypothetical protein
MQQNDAKYGGISIFKDIYCTVLIRVDKMGFHKRYDFVSLSTDSFLICNDWSLAVEWSEVFSAFCKNALIQKTNYDVGENTVFSFNVEDGPPKLYMQNSVNGGQRYAFSKLECSQVYSKMSKILSKCDLISQER